MTIDEYNRFCRTLTATTHVVQWGGAHVWKVGGKVFAIGGWNDDDQALHVTFKCSGMSYDMLREMPGCRPAPYLASRGMKWIQRTSADALDDRGLKDYMRASYDLVIEGLPKRTQHELGLADTAQAIKASSKTAPKGGDKTQSMTTPRTTRTRGTKRKGACT